MSKAYLSLSFDTREKKALTREQYKEEIRNGRSESEFRLSTRYTAVFNAGDIEVQ